MDIKISFAIALMMVFSAVTSLFGWSVYGQVKDRLLLSAESTLAADMDREWRHLQSHGGVTGLDSDPAGAEEIYYHTLKGTELVADTVPRSLKDAGGGVTPLWSDRIQRKFSGEVAGSHYDLIGYYDLRSTYRYLGELRATLIHRSLFALLLFAPMSYLLAKLLLRPFRRFSHRTESLDARSLSFRFPAPARSDEYGVLIRCFNVLLGRLEASFQQLRRFATNASHELRTPLTVIRGEAELLLRRPREVADYRAGLEKIVERADGLQQIISRLLYFADIERLQLDHSVGEIAIGEKVKEVVDAFQKSHGRKKTVVVPAEELKFRGPTDLVSSVLTNILENALKYSSAKVRVSYEIKNAGLMLEVADDGPGIPAAKRAMVFEPFFKLSDAERKQSKAESHGLGLSIVKACTDAAKGKVELEESAWGGLLVRVWFPETV